MTLRKNTENLTTIKTLNLCCSCTFLSCFLHDAKQNLTSNLISKSYLKHELLLIDLFWATFPLSVCCLTWALRTIISENSYCGDCKHVEAWNLVKIMVLYGLILKFLILFILKSKNIRQWQLNFLLYRPNQLYFLANQNNNNTDFTFKYFTILLFIFLPNMIFFFWVWIK